MNFSDKTVLVIGAAISGIPVCKFLYKKGAKVIINDFKDIELIKDVIDELKDLNIKIVTGGHPIELAKQCDLVVISPGVPTDIDLVKEAKLLGIEVISEIELSSRLIDTPILAITGTNGKTTTTALLGEIMENSGLKTFVTGNIGHTMIIEVENAKSDDLFVVELSSFQLESIVKFRPKVSAILNITPDHLNRHKTLENYIEAKCNIFKNQTAADFTVLNADDYETSKLISYPKSKVLPFSRKKELEQGAFVKDGYIVIRLDNKEETIIHRDQIFIPGDHNLENALAASLMAYCMGVCPEIIADTLKNFKGVEHRIEFVEEIDGVEYYNDSKGTNPDASIKAVLAMKRHIVLIAGGMDKGSEFSDFIKSFDQKVKAMVLFGETAEKIQNTALHLGFNNIFRVNNLEEAVRKCSEIAKSGDCVLLSPACASWDMFKSYEERGKLFKKLVRCLRGSDECLQKIKE